MIRMLIRLLSTLTLIALLLTSCIETYPRELRKKQELMAQELGVKVEDYGPAIRFPWGYLRAWLTPGMSIQQVHQIIPKHEAVYRCETDSIPSEIYYFLAKRMIKRYGLKLFMMNTNIINFRDRKTETALKYP